MAFRGDEDARKARIEALEKELAEARADHESVAKEEQAKEAKRDELAARVAELEKSLQRAKDPTAEPPPDPEAERKTPVAPKPVPKPSLWDRLATLVGTTFWIPFVCCPIYCGLQDCRPQCEMLDRHVELTWNGTVTAASAINIPIDTPCRIRGSFWESRGAVAVGTTGDAELTVACAGRELFTGEGASCLLSQYREGNGWAYTPHSCTFRDGSASATWSSGYLNVTPASGGTVTIAGGSTTSAAALYEPAEVDRRLHEGVGLAGTVAAVSGSSPVAPGDVCTLSIQPTSGTVADEQNCTVLIICGTTTLRRETLECDLHQSRFRRARGTGLWVDVASGRAVVHENGPGLPYRANIRIEP